MGRRATRLRSSGTAMPEPEAQALRRLAALAARRAEARAMLEEGSAHTPGRHREQRCHRVPARRSRLLRARPSLAPCSGAASQEVLQGPRQPLTPRPRRRQACTGGRVAAAGTRRPTLPARRPPRRQGLSGAGWAARRWRHGVTRRCRLCSHRCGWACPVLPMRPSVAARMIDEHGLCHAPGAASASSQQWPQLRCLRPRQLRGASCLRSVPGGTYRPPPPMHRSARCRPTRRRAARDSAGDPGRLARHRARRSHPRRRRTASS